MLHALYWYIICNTILWSIHVVWHVLWCISLLKHAIIHSSVNYWVGNHQCWWLPASAVTVLILIFLYRCLFTCQIVPIRIKLQEKTYYVMLPCAHCHGWLAFWSNCSAISTWTSCINTMVQEMLTNAHFFTNQWIILQRVILLHCNFGIWIMDVYYTYT